MKTAKEIAIWNGLDNHPELEECIKAIEEYHAQFSSPVGELPPTDILSNLHKNGTFFRVEDDEDGYYISIINRQIYPRVWADIFANGDTKVIAETAENILNRTVAISEKDWSERFFGETIEEALNKVKASLNK